MSVHGTTTCAAHIQYPSARRGASAIVCVEHYGLWVRALPVFTVHDKCAEYTRRVTRDVVRAPEGGFPCTGSK
jgi:hypothetical protein